MTQYNQSLQPIFSESGSSYTYLSEENISLLNNSFSQIKSSKYSKDNIRIIYEFYNGNDDELISHISMNKKTNSISDDSFRDIFKSEGKDEELISVISMEEETDSFEHLFDSEDENENECNIFMNDELLSNIDSDIIRDYLSEFNINNYDESYTYMESCNSLSIESNELQNIQV